ncbi:hypothetical protein [uncultured Bacteroides sp.]|uniref:hypothetical protein n=1 Tax=uncultured Bacteroides sp. TaxID=162156 RepID=UPI00280BC793|nr:hypothetical protein [uncultured Bacteroides sp.]
MKSFVSFLSIVLFSCNTIFAQSNSDGSFALKKENGHYYFETLINEKAPAKMMLESGIFVMVMDSLYAFENKEAINLDYTRTQGNENMNLGGKVYDITHKAKGKVQLGNNVEYCGEIFILSGYNTYSGIAIPIQNIYNTEDGSRIIKLDMEKLEFCSMSRKQFQSEVGDYAATAINYNSYMGMPAVKTHLDFEKDGKNYSLPGNYLLDLGNASFVFLMKQSQVVQGFLHDNQDIELKKAYNKKGVLVAEAIVTEKASLCNRGFEKQVIAITSALPKFTVEGSVGLKFFEGAVSVFDFEKQKFYTK